MLTRTGYLVDAHPDLRKELTVKPIVEGDFGQFIKPFKVFREKSGKICVPRFYGVQKFGEASEDKRPEPQKVHINFTGTLRDETRQHEALAKALEAGSGVLSLPCGFGKTTVALAISAALGYRTMIIVHKEFLMNQWIERIKQFCPGATIGIVQRDRLEVDCDFVIAMLQSLVYKEYTLEHFEKVGTLIIDEAHHICAAVFSQSMFRLCPRHIFGLSATPERKDGLTKVLHWFIGPNFFTVKRVNQDQVTVKKINFTCEEYTRPPPTTRSGQICVPQMITDLVENPARNQLIINLIRKAHEDNPTRHMLVLTDRRDHCHFLHQEFPLVSGLYMGGMKEAELEKSKGKTLVIGTFQQAHEGLDIETLDTVFLVTPKSNIEQSVGRILRGKARNQPVIYDLCDQWSLLCSMYRKRAQVYNASGFKIELSAEESERERKKPKLENLFKDGFFIRM